MATTTKKSATKKSASAAKKAAKKGKPRKLFTLADLKLIDSKLRPALGKTFTNKVINVLQDAVGTPPRV